MAMNDRYYFQLSTRNFVALLVSAEFNNIYVMCPCWWRLRGT